MTGPQILVVEDEKIVAMDLQNMLKGLNYSLTPAAGTAGEALQRVATHRPDLVLMDIRLQGPIDGIAAARQIRDQFGIPVIYVTAH
jgi:CheY-like chemotaxis protein